MNAYDPDNRIAERHAEPQMQARRKSDRIQAAHRADECARELKEALWGAAAIHAGVEL